MNSTGWGTIGRANCVLYDQQSVVDNHVTIIRVKDDECDPLYLATYLNSRAGSMQTDKWLSGSSGQVEIYPDDIARFLVYLPPKRIQEEVADLIQRSYQADGKARSLLEEAKAAANAAVEEGAAKPVDAEGQEQRETWDMLKKAIDLNRAGSRQLFS